MIAPRSWRGGVLPHLEQAVLVRKGCRMKMEEVQALGNELRQLNVELKRFKEELLTKRIEEFEQIVHAPARRSHLRMPEISMSINQDVN